MTDNNKGKLNVKIIFIILGVILVIELILGIRSIMTNQSTGSSQSVVRKVPLKGTITLTADKTEVNVGDKVTLTIIVTSPVAVDGVDLVAKYDPKILSASDNSIHTGTIFPQYPLSKIDSAGFLRISGISNPNTARFAGKGVFATVDFKAVKSGKAEISVVFTQGSTTDSNIIGAANEKPLLEEAGKLEVTVK